MAGRLIETRPFDGGFFYHQKFLAMIFYARDDGRDRDGRFPEMGHEK
jgi:hypothetical protein